MLTAPCELLDWDTQFFGVRIARVTAAGLQADSAAAIDDWCRAQRVSCLYFLADSRDQQSVRQAEANHYHLVDVRVTLMAGPGANGAGSRPADPATIRLAQRSDLKQLRAIARVSHQASRFYADPHFDRALCDRLYETWIERSCDGYADIVFAAECDGQVAGYLSAHRQRPEHGTIGLVGVGAEFQRRQIGEALVQAGLNWFREQGTVRVTVATQGRNVPAQRLYQRCGFQTDSVGLWYHKWFASEYPPEQAS